MSKLRGSGSDSSRQETIGGAATFSSKEVSVLRMDSGKSVLAAGFIGLVVSFFWSAASAAPLPDPATDVPKAAAKGQASAVFAGGCFWGGDAGFQPVKGVNGGTS